MSAPGRILILGAGPTGLGAAYRLRQVGGVDFLVLEAKPEPGGLASSYVDNQGFTWDVGGHVQFSHYERYDVMIDEVLGDQRLFHERQSWVWLKERFVPYPFQKNLHRLDPSDRDRALAGLEQAQARSYEPPEDFQSWIDLTFGPGLAELFMVPYNEKVWGYPLETLNASWVGERVAAPDLERLRRQIASGQDDVSWGPNNRFFFPLHGGTGAIWQRLAARLFPDHEPKRLRLRATVKAIDLERKTVSLEDGHTESYDRLVSSLPLDVLCSLCSGLPPQVHAAARSLVHSSCHIVGVGLRGEMPEALRKKCWMYFPEPHSPYYRVTVFSNYSPHNVPKGDGYWSLMAEVCETPHRPVAAERVVDNVVGALGQDRLIPAGTEVTSRWHRREEHGYPTPFLGRDPILQSILHSLEAQQVYSRGRFGAWKYEVSNQDHSFMQGVEVIDRLLGLGDEVTVHHPEIVNRR